MIDKLRDKLLNEYNSEINYKKVFFQQLPFFISLFVVLYLFLFESFEIFVKFTMVFIHTTVVVIIMILYQINAKKIKPKDK